MRGEDLAQQSTPVLYSLLLISSRHKGSKHSVYIHSPLRLSTNLLSVAFVDLVIDVKVKHGNCKTGRSLAQISSVHMWTESDFGVCSGARTSERGSIYDPDDLSGRCSPLPAERRKHRHHLKTKVSIQPEQQYCPREYIDKAHVHNWASWQLAVVLNRMNTFKNILTHLTVIYSNMHKSKIQKWRKLQWKWNKEVALNTIWWHVVWCTVNSRSLQDEICFWVERS